MAQEALYEASSDKKSCPNCGSCQSYNEVLNDKTICTNEICKGRFRYEKPVAFRLKTFQDRMERSTRRREQTVNRIKEERANTSHMPVCSKGRRQKQLIAKVDSAGKDFLARMTDDIAKRRGKKSRREEGLQEHEAKMCTFKPKLNTSKDSYVPKKSRRISNASVSTSDATGNSRSSTSNVRISASISDGERSGSTGAWRKSPRSSMARASEIEKPKLLHFR